MLRRLLPYLLPSKRGDHFVTVAVNFIVLSLISFFSLSAYSAKLPFDLEGCIRALNPGASPQIMIDTDALVARDLAETEELAAKIIKLANLSSHEFVMLGRSPTLIAAWFAASRIHFTKLQAWVMPVSLKDNRQTSMPSLNARFKRVEEVFRESSQDELPKVYIDAVTAGRTLIALDKILVSLHRSALLIGFSDDVVTARAQLERAHVVNRYELIEVSHEYMMRLAQHKQFAPYASYAIEDTAVDLTNAPPASARFFDLRTKVQNELYGLSPNSK